MKDSTTHPHDATYSPEDDKVRIYPAWRLDPEEFQAIKGAGFRWAPKQELFFATWSPRAEDAAEALCGEIGDEDTSLVDRSAERAERFEGYSKRRAAESAREHERVSAIADGIPLGQPILVGHHSERRARKDAERIENGMRRALRLWDTSEYWRQRAAGAIAAAKYKERPAVRARRIKKLEADRRREERSFTPNKRAGTIVQEPFGAWRCRKENHPDAETCAGCEAQPHVWCGPSRGGCWVRVRSLPARQARAERWIAHLDRRLEYERAMLAEQGATELLEPKPRRKLPPILNYRAPGGVEVWNNYSRGETYRLEQVETTKAAFAAVHSDYKGTSTSVDKSHRVRSAMRRFLPGQPRSLESCGLVAVYLTDSKDHGAPEGSEQ